MYNSDVKICRVWGVYFSPTGTTKRVVGKIGKTAASRSGIVCGGSVPFYPYDFTLPGKRNADCRNEKTDYNVAMPEFLPGDIVILGVPVYAGRVPNLLLPFLQSIKGQGAWGVPVVLYGNRSFDDALAELTDIMEYCGFAVIAAAAFVGQHSFSEKIAVGRPDDKDMALAERFGVAIADKIGRLFRYPDKLFSVSGVPGAEAGRRVYYQPAGASGNRIDIRKVKPLTRSSCDNCGICAGVCPMGAIDNIHPDRVSGICIKCCACLKQCPRNAKYFADEGFLYHVGELESSLTGRGKTSIFI